MTIKKVNKSSSSEDKTAYISSSLHGNMTVQVNQKKETLLPILYKALQEEYGQEREGIHVSDLIYCPRKTCFQRLKPLPITNLQLNFFTSGKAIHAALQGLVKKYPKRFTIEKEIWFEDIVAHVDLFDEETGMPIEAKSARVKAMLTPKSHNLVQLRAYMAMTNSDKGIILYQCLLHFEDNPFVEFEHTMTREERVQTLNKLSVDADLLRKGIEAKDPSIVRHIAYDNNFRDKVGGNWLCKSCPYAVECTSMRATERAGDF
jgi:CRISPR/Cas system-associated exonuclease Cas4 (RecB family)